MEQISEFWNKVWHTDILNSIIVILISLILYKAIAYVFFKGKNNEKVFKSKKTKTYLRMLKSILRYVFFAITILILLQINGVNVSSMLAGV